MIRFKYFHFKENESPNLLTHSPLTDWTSCYCGCGWCKYRSKEKSGGMGGLTLPLNWDVRGFGFKQCSLCETSFWRFVLFKPCGHCYSTAFCIGRLEHTDMLPSWCQILWTLWRGKSH